MRGEFQDQGGLFSYVDPEKRIPAGHPLRQVRALVREVLKDLSRSFSRLYSHEGESVRLTVCAGSMVGCDQRIVVGKRSAKKMTNWA
jgi:hypothetical protein